LNNPVIASYRKGWPGENLIFVTTLLLFIGFICCQRSFNWAEIWIHAPEKFSCGQANWGILFGNLTDKTAKLPLMTFAYSSSSYLLYDLYSSLGLGSWLIRMGIWRTYKVRSAHIFDGIVLPSHCARRRPVQSCQALKR